MMKKVKNNMVTIKKKLSLPEYRERKSVYETLGYKEIKAEQKKYKVVVTYEVDDSVPYYHDIRKLERKLYRKGPSFLPVLFFVAVSFTLLSVFVVLLAKEGNDFDLLSNSLGFLLPAFIMLALAVAYTYLYFTINRRIIEESPYLKENLTSIISDIKNK